MRSSGRRGLGSWWWILILLVPGIAVWIAREVLIRPEPTPDRRGPATVDDRLAEFGEKARRRWRPSFRAAGVAFPPARVALLGFKDEKILEVHATDADGKFRFIRRMEILGASGGPGPKLREGDRQVPEGLYRIELLNPNSRFHVSLRVNYPNPADLRRAAAEGRTEPGSDIMIHGGSQSIGCLAVGDDAAEDLFALAAWSGLSNITVILAPVDFRKRSMDELPPGAPAWTGELYREIAQALRAYPDPG